MIFILYQVGFFPPSLFSGLCLFHFVFPYFMVFSIPDLDNACGFLTSLDFTVSIVSKMKTCLLLCFDREKKHVIWTTVTTTFNIDCTCCLFCFVNHQYTILFEISMLLIYRTPCLFWHESDKREAKQGEKTHRWAKKKKETSKGSLKLSPLKRRSNNK